MAERLGVDFIEVSAKKEINITELFVTLVRRINALKAKDSPKSDGCVVV